MGHWISKLNPDRVSGITSLPVPTTKKQTRQLLGLLGYCRQWIEGHSEKAKCSYEKLTLNSLKCTLDERWLEQLKDALITAPVLSLPDLSRPFQLFEDMSNQTAYGVLSQDWAGSKKPIEYFSKLLVPISRGWSTCLQALVAVALIVEET